MIKAHGQRCLLQIDKVYLKEKGKPVLDEEGTPRYTLDQRAKVIQSNVEGIKKGQTCYPIIRGGVPITHLEDKKKYVISIDSEDIYAIE